MGVHGTGPGIHFQGADARTTLAQGKVGEPAQTGRADQTFTAINSSPQSFEVWTVTVDTAVNDTVYAYEVNGGTVSYTSDPSATTAEIQAGLVLAHNDDFVARGVSEAGGADPDVVITGLLEGISFPVSTSDANLTAAQTNDAAKADWIPFGRAMIDQGYHPDEPVRLGALSKAALLTAQVDDWLLVYDALVTYQVTITIEEATYFASLSFAAASDIATQGALLAAAVNAALPADSVLASFVTATLTLTAEVAGKSFDSSISFAAPEGAVVDTAAATLTTTGLASDDLIGSLIGVSRNHKTVENQTRFGEDPAYAPNSGVVVDNHNDLWVLLDAGATVAHGGIVYVGTATDEEGRMYPDAAAGRIKAPTSKLRWLRQSTDSRDSIAVVQIRL